VSSNVNKVFEDVERRRVCDLLWVLGDPRGRRVFQRLVDILYECGSERHEFHAGRRSVASAIRDEALEASLEMVSLAHSEALADAEKIRSRIALAHAADAEEREKL
jgi:hypothetical protein